ncbi:MAG TPA: DUF669 domain-containing protein [Hyphomonas sp.]|nr:DUF669 domain-containing protein [Hyphomonas sp.]
MARLGVRVEATEESTQQRDFGNVPDGIYKLEITASEVSIKNENTREQATTVKVTYDIIEPEEYKGRKIFNNFNVEHPKAQVQEIGQRQFSCQLRAIEMTESPEDTDELHMIAFMAKIGMGKDSKEKNADGTPVYPARNEVKLYYYPDQGELPEPVITGTVPAPTRQPAANDNRRAPENDSRQSAPATGEKRRPWGSKRWGGMMPSPSLHSAGQ